MDTAETSDARLERVEASLARIEAVTRRLATLEARLPDAIAVATDTLDALISRAAERGVDVDERLALILRAAERLTSREALVGLEAALDSGMLDASAVSVLGKVGRALTEVATEPPRPVGALGLLRALRDPDVQRAVGLAIAVARALGRALETPPLLLEPSR